MVGVEASVDSCGPYLRTHSAGQGPNSLPCDTGHTHTLGATVSTHTEKSTKPQKKKRCQQSALPFSSACFMRMLKVLTASAMNLQVQSASTFVLLVAAVNLNELFFF